MRTRNADRLDRAKSEREREREREGERTEMTLVAPTAGDSRGDREVVSSFC